MVNKRARVLVVDDEQANLDALKKILEQEAYEVVVADQGEKALATYRRLGADLVITDLRMPGISGMDLLRAVRKLSPELPVILLTAYGTVDDAVEAMKVGAVDFLSKPIRRTQLLNAVQDVLVRKRSPRGAGQPAQPQFIGQSPMIQEIRREIRLLAPTGAHVLIQGESGTGKELVAQAVHAESGRKGKLVTVNCGAIPEPLLESELFGYMKGAFTGAVSSKVGLFETAHEGTLFLDEVGEMPLSLQVKLLRVLQNQEFYKVGGTELRKADVRIVAATNANLEERVRLGTFREDLFYRLNVIRLQIPALRERREDILTLARTFLEDSMRVYGKPGIGWSADVEESLQAYDWPGNVRELRNMVERAVVLCDGKEIRREHLRLPQVAKPSGASVSDPAQQFTRLAKSVTFPLGTPLREVEDVMIRETLAALGGNKVLAAKLLGVNLRTIYRKVGGGKEESLPPASLDDEGALSTEGQA